MKKLSRRQFAGGVAAGLAAAAIVRPAAAQARWKWDLPAGYPATNFHSVNLIQFAKDVKDASGGKLEITVHPGASLFKVPEIMRAVQTGQAQIGELLMGNMQNEDALFGIDQVPFLATSFDQAKRLADLAKPHIEKRLQARGMRYSFAVPWPPQGFYSPKPLAGPDDLKGLLFRSYGPSAGRLAELAGMRVTQIEAAEAAQAFATGRVNSMISSGATGFDIKIFEHIKFFYDVQAWLPKNLIMINQRAWASLDDATRTAVTKAAEVAEGRGWGASRLVQDDMLGKLRQNGMTVQPPTPPLATAFKRWGEDLMQDWLRRAGADGQAVVNAFRAAG